MNKTLKKIIAAVFVCISFAAIGSIEAFAAPKYVKIVGEPVAVRDDAGTSAKYIKQLHHDNLVVYLSEKNDRNGTKWYQVKIAGDKKGWVTSVYTETESKSQLNCSISVPDRALRARYSVPPESDHSSIISLPKRTTAISFGIMSTITKKTQHGCWGHTVRTLPTAIPTIIPHPPLRKNGCRL